MPKYIVAVEVPATCTERYEVAVMADSPEGAQQVVTDMIRRGETRRFGYVETTKAYGHWADARVEEDPELLEEQ